MMTVRREASAMSITIEEEVITRESRKQPNKHRRQIGPSTCGDRWALIRLVMYIVYIVYTAGVALSSVHDAAAF